MNLHSCFSTVLLVRFWLHRLQQIWFFKYAFNKRIPKCSCHELLLFSFPPAHLWTRAGCRRTMCGLSMSYHAAAQGNDWTEDSQQLPTSNAEIFPVSTSNPWHELALSTNGLLCPGHTVSSHQPAAAGKHSLCQRNRGKKGLSWSLSERPFFWTGLVSDFFSAAYP